MRRKELMPEIGVEALVPILRGNVLDRQSVIVTCVVDENRKGPEAFAKRGNGRFQLAYVRKICNPELRPVPGLLFADVRHAGAGFRVDIDETDPGSLRAEGLDQIHADAGSTPVISTPFPLRLG